MGPSRRRGKLAGLTTGERREVLIEIAHPELRGELRNA